jgi:hypothetical protein
MASGVKEDPIGAIQSQIDGFNKFFEENFSAY